MNAEKTHKVAVWIRIPRLPIELYNETFLRRIGMTMGSFLKVDRLTSIHSREKFARICVEIDLEKPLATHITVRGCPLYLEYEGLHAFCFRCGKVGHKKDQCREVVEGERYAKEDEGTQSNGGEATDGAAAANPRATNLTAAKAEITGANQEMPRISVGTKDENQVVDPV